MAAARGSSAIGPGGARENVVVVCNFRRARTGHEPTTPSSPRALGPGPAARVVLALVAGYKRFLSPLLPRACRFSPSCSEYARLAILKHGVVGGSWRALGRVLRCHPFHPGGVDLP